jgi:hypothetical protein
VKRKLLDMVQILSESGTWLQSASTGQNYQRDMVIWKASTRARASRLQTYNDVGSRGQNCALASKGITVHEVYSRAITTLPKEMSAACHCHIRGRSSSRKLEERCEKSEE